MYRRFLLFFAPMAVLLGMALYTAPAGAYGLDRGRGVEIAFNYRDTVNKAISAFEEWKEAVPPVVRVLAYIGIFLFALLAFVLCVMVLFFFIMLFRRR